MEIMEISGIDKTDDRTRTLEKKIRDMEALAKGLIEETLDLKSVIMTMSKVAEESSRQELRRAPVVRSTAAPAPAAQSTFPLAAAPADGCIVIQPRVSRQPEVTTAAAEPKMALIMQTDGTMKMEPRCGDRNQTDSTGGYRPEGMARLSRPGKTRG
jgi:hypothetical protein